MVGDGLAQAVLGSSPMSAAISASRSSNALERLNARTSGCSHGRTPNLWRVRAYQPEAFVLVIRIPGSTPGGLPLIRGPARGGSKSRELLPIDQRSRQMSGCPSTRTYVRSSARAPERSSLFSRYLGGVRHCRAPGVEGRAGERRGGNIGK